MILNVQGHETFCYTGGKPFDTAKPTVVFVHGALNDHSVWPRIITPIHQDWVTKLLACQTI